MAHHKRKGPKSTRAGCLLCKPHKHQATRPKDRLRFGQIRRLAAAREEIAEALAAPSPGADRAQLETTGRDPP